MQYMKAILFFLLFTLSACMPFQAQGEATRSPFIGIAHLQPTTGESVYGTVQFIPQGSGLRVIANVHGLTPGTHGFHIHEYGDCTSTVNASSAGSHYSLVSQTHGKPGVTKSHAGDLFSLEANEAGDATYETMYTSLKNLNLILGRSVVIHEKTDDYKTQPSGNSGNRIACGVIGIAKS